jgi:hypothetical protein
MTIGAAASYIRQRMDEIAPERITDMNLNPFRGPSLGELEQQARELDAKTKSLEDADEDASFNLLARPDDREVKKARADAERALKAHQQLRAELTKQINVARRRQGKAEKKRIRNERAKARDTSMSLATESETAGADLQAALVAAAEAGRRLMEARRALREACPLELVDYGDLHGFFVGRDSLNAAMKIETFRNGLDFAVTHWPEPVEEIPSLVDRLKRVNAILRQRLDEDAAGDAAAAE